MFINFINKKYIHLYLLGIIFLLSTFFSFYRIGSSIMNIDGERWYLRTSNFIKNVKELDFKGTYQNSKPGITVMWLSGISNEIFNTIYETKFNYRPDFFAYDKFSLVFTSYVLPLVLVNLITGVIFYFLIYKLFNNHKVAILSYTLYSLHPYSLGMSRFLHVDSVMTNFVTLSYLTFQLYQKNDRNIKMLVISGFLYGLSMLTKTQALVVMPIFILSRFIYVLFNNNYLLKKPSDKFVIIGKILISKKFISPLALFILSASLSFIVFFPAVWVSPVEIFKKVFLEAIYVARIGRSQDNIVPFYYYFFLIRHTLSFAIAFGFLVSVVFLFFKRNIIDKNSKINNLNILIFPIFYFIGVSFSVQKIDRYLLPVIPFALVICSISISYLKHFKIFYLSILSILLITLIYSSPNYGMYGYYDSRYPSTYGYMLKEVSDYIKIKSEKKYPSVVISGKKYSLKPFVRGNVYDTQEIVNLKESIDFYVKESGQELDSSVVNSYGCEYVHTVKYHKYPVYDIYKCVGKI